MAFAHLAASHRSTVSCRAGFSFVGLLAIVVAVGGVLGAVYYFMPAQQETDTPFVFTVTRGEFIDEVTERGEIESANSAEIKCLVPLRGAAGIQILRLVPEYTRVEANDFLAQLDDSALKDEHKQQAIVCTNANAAVTQANSLLQTAEVAKQEYLEGLYQQEMQLIQSEIFVAKENQRRAEEYAEYSKRLARQGYVTSLQLEADQFAVDKARKELETAATKLRVLQDFTKKKMLQQLESDIKSAEAGLSAARESATLENEKLAELQRQIDLCTVRAPSAGEVVYENRRNSRSGSVEIQIEQGAQVKEAQTMFRIPDPTQMRVTTKVNESRIDVVHSGLPATIRLMQSRGKTGQVLRGVVQRIEKAALPQRWSGSSIKEYATYVRIDNPPPDLRIGLTAEVKILVQTRPNVLQVPVQAVVKVGQQNYCLIKGDGDELKPRKVVLGPTNGKYVVIEEVEKVSLDAGAKSANEGLKEGEVVITNPRKFVSRFFNAPKTEEAAGAYSDKLRQRYKGGGQPGDPSGAPGGRPGGGAPKKSGVAGGAPGGAGPGKRPSGGGRAGASP